jgi:hypothetical protein
LRPFFVAVFSFLRDNSFCGIIEAKHQFADGFMLIQKKEQGGVARSRQR